MSFQDDTAGDFSGFGGPVTAPNLLEDSMSYKFFNALDSFRRKVQLPSGVDAAFQKPQGHAAKTAGAITSVVGQGMAAVGEEAATMAKDMANMALPEGIEFDVKKPGQAFRERSAAVAEDLELYDKEKKIRPQIEAQVMKDNVGSKVTLKRRIDEAVAQRLFQDGIFTERPRGPASLFVQGVGQGASYGVFDGYASEAIRLARIMKNPYTTSEQVGHISGNLAGGLVAYGAVAQRVGAGLKTVPALRQFAGKHWFLFNAGLQNLGEEAVDMTIRKATGQTYGKSDFLLGMGFGASAETLFAGVRALKNLNLTPVQKHLNTEVESFVREFDRYPDFEADLYPRLERQYVPGTKMTYGEAFESYRGEGERRLAYFSGIDPKTGMPPEGRPGMDRPAPLPETPSNADFLASLKTQTDGQPIAFHGTQAKQIRGTPNPTDGSMGKAFYLTNDAAKAKSFGRDGRVDDSVMGAQGKMIKRTLREPEMYPDSNVFEFDLSKLKIKEVADDAEFFRHIPSGDVADASVEYRLLGFDGVRNKTTGTTAIYNTENLRPKAAAQPRVDELTEQTARAAADATGGGRPGVTAAKVLGQEPTPFVKMREKTLLAYKLNAESRGARKAFFTTKRSIKEAQDDLIDYAKLTLGPKERGKVLSILKSTQDQKSLKRAIGKVNDLVVQMNRREQIADVKDVMRSDFLDKLPIAYRRQIVEKVSEYALSKPTDATRTIAQQVEEQLEAGTEEIAPSLLKKAEQVRKTALADLEPDELAGLHAMVKDLVEQGKVNALLAKGEKAFDVQTSAQEVDGALGWWAQHGAKPNAFLQKLWFADLEYTTPDRFFDMLDGFKGYKGTMFGTFKAPVDAATSGFMRDFDRVIRETSEKVNLNGMSKESMDRIGTYGLWQRNDAGKFIGREKLRLRGIEEPPELTAKDVSKFAVAVQQIAGALVGAETQGWIDKETAGKIFGVTMGFVGVEIDYETVKKTLQEKDATKGYEDYVGDGKKPVAGEA